MTRFTRTSNQVLVASILLAGLSACGTGESGERELSDVATDQAPPPTTVAAVMKDKLAHAEEIFVGMSLADFRQIEVNAVALYELSQQSDWMVHRTVNYTMFSDQFRGVVLELANHAREGDLGAVRSAYQRMINSCFDCHDYLRHENLISDFPGRVGWISEPSLLAELAAGT